MLGRNRVRVPGSLKGPRGDVSQGWELGWGPKVVDQLKYHITIKVLNQ